LPQNVAFAGEFLATKVESDGNHARPSAIRRISDKMISILHNWQLALHSHPENRNTVVFESYYKVSGMNQHKYEYRFKGLAQKDERFAEWNMQY
jgi:hypothetical protein